MREIKPNINNRIRQYLEESGGGQGRDYPLPVRTHCAGCGALLTAADRAEDPTHGRMCLACQNAACARMLGAVLVGDNDGTLCDPVPRPPQRLTVDMQGRPLGIGRRRRRRAGGVRTLWGVVGIAVAIFVGVVLTLLLQALWEW